jgi:hypothetical protein
MPADFVVNGIRASDGTRLPEEPGDLEDEPTCRVVYDPSGATLALT